MSACTCAGDHVGCLLMISRAVPATKGVAIDVPLYETYPFVVELQLQPQ